MDLYNQDCTERRNGQFLISFKKSQNPAAYLGTLIVCISAGLLPLVDAFPTAIRYSVFAIGLVLFTLGIIKNSRFFLFYILTLLLELLVNLFAFYHSYSQIYVFRRYMIRSTECWLIMAMALYYVNSSDYIAKRKLTNAIIFISTITSITSIIAIYKYPNMEIVRSLANGNIGLSDDLIQKLYLQNVSTWGLCYAIVFLIPLIIAEYKENKNKFLLLIIAIMSFFVLQAQITFAIIFLIVFLFFLFFVPPKSVKFIILIVMGVILFILMIPLISSLLLYIFNYLASVPGTNVIRSRIWGLYKSLAGGSAYGDSKARFDLYYISIKAFFSHPLLGGNEIGQHSQIFDLLASVGVLGATPLLVLFIYYLKNIFSSIKSEIRRRYYFLLIFVFVLLLFMNPVFYSPIIFMSIFLFPVVIDGKEAVVNNIRKYTD